jgi:hypothetical protein
MEIAIPSYGRHITLPVKTLSALWANGFKKDNVTIFVVAEEEELYKATCHGWKVVVGVKGLPQQREFITRYYPQGTPIVFLDDDIESFFFLQTHKESVADVFNKGFELCLENGCRLWGIYPVPNQYFMGENYTTALKYIVGACYGLINYDAEPEFERGDKEDVYRSLAYYLKDGAVIRMNWLSVKTKYYTEPGGLQLTRTAQTNLDASEKICAMFPDLATLWIRPRTGMAEVRLKDRR